MSLVKRLGDKIEQHPTEVKWLLVPAMAATGVSLAVGTPPMHHESKKEMAQMASSYLNDQAENNPIDEFAVKSQIYALKSSQYYRQGNAVVLGDYVPLFTPSEIQTAVGPLEAAMNSNPTDAQLRTEIKASARYLDELAAGIRTTYSPEVSLSTAAGLYSVILLAYGLHRLIGPLAKDQVTASKY